MVLARLIARSLTSFVALTIFSSLSAAPYADCPVTRKEPLVETIHGRAVSDPYRWMENLDTPDLPTWVREQNALTDRRLAGPLHDELVAEFTEIFASGLGKSEELRRERELRQWRMRRLLPLQATLGTSWKGTSPTGRYTTTTISESSGDLRRLEIFDNAESRLLKDSLMGKSFQVYWRGDEKGFIYKIDRDGRLGDTYPAVFRHQLGTRQSQDHLLYEAPTPDTDLDLVWNRGFLLLIETGGQDGVLRLKRLDEETGRVEWTHEGFDYTFEVVDFTGDELTFITYQDVSFGEVKVFNARTREVHTIFVAETAPIEEAAVVDGDLMLALNHDVESRLYRYDRQSRSLSEIKLPGRGSISLFMEDDGLRVFYGSYSERDSGWKYDVAGRELVLEYPASPTPFDVEATKLHYRAHNGREAAVWLVRKKDTALTPSTPMYMYGYGGFRINQMPYFSESRVPFLKRGGVVAVVTLPGGLEYGEDWHREGMRHNKKNVFDDFARAAKMLIDMGYTSPRRLAIAGGSNGGLLVGATINLYPDLFAAGVPGVGVMDLTRFQLFTGGKWWVHEYGNRDVAQDYSVMLSLSPYHNLAQRFYPAILVSTSDLDDRVVPSHSFKYLARLQEMQGCQRPALLTVKKGGSHSSASGTLQERARQAANEWTFIMKELGMAD